MIKKISLFTKKRDFITTFFLLSSLLFYALLMQYNNYKNLTRFDSQLVTATLLKEYNKTKITAKGKIKKYKILKLKSDTGFTFYTTSKNRNLTVGQSLQLEIWTKKINFYDYMTNFYAFSKILTLKKELGFKQKFNTFIASQHTDKNIAHIYQALFSAKQLNSDIQQQFSSLGISHLIAISGFHLGVLSALLFFLFKKPYQFFQNRWFPYRSYKIDSFIIIACMLFSYLLFLDSPDSLLRAFGMLIVGYVLYDRGMKVVSMETLFISILFLLAFFPRLTFSLGFGLSVAGVFYIFLFLIYFQDLNKKWQFLLIPIWVYLMMLPYSIVIFTNFSFYHPLSIIWSTFFIPFYPISIFLHIINQGNYLDFMIAYLLHLNTHVSHISLNFQWLMIYILLSLGSIYSKKLLYLSIIFSTTIFIYAIYYIT